MFRDLLHIDFVRLSTQGLRLKVLSSLTLFFGLRGTQTNRKTFRWNDKFTILGISNRNRNYSSFHLQKASWNEGDWNMKQKIQKFFQHFES